VRDGGVDEAVVVEVIGGCRTGTCCANDRLRPERMVSVVNHRLPSNWTMREIGDFSIRIGLVGVGG
jgi:hypothetical protein